MNNSTSDQPRPDDDRTRLATPAPAPPDPGHGYSGSLKIEGVVGEGGMGRVLLGYDETIGRRVAVKELLTSSAAGAGSAFGFQEIKNTFLHEAKLTGKLEHPGIIPIYQLGELEHDRPYYVMRYVRGETLETLLQDCQRRPPAERLALRLKLLDVLIDVCDTLAYAHAKGVIHRDLKPSNVIRGEFGETIVLDWGLAQVLADSDNTYFFREAQTHQRHTLNDTLSNETVGTPFYMAPEQFNGRADKRSDVYSLGVILFRLLTGGLPYGGDLEDIRQRLTDGAPSPSPYKYEKSAPRELVAICDKAMHKDSRLRFADAKEMVEQLKAFRDGRIVNIYAYSRQELLRRFLTRNKPLAYMSLALLAAVLAGAGFSVHYALAMHQAKSQVEKSLVTVTTFSETAQKQAQIVATAIKQGTAQLFDDLHAAADELSKSNLAEESQVLDKLQTLYPKFDRFSLKPIGAISPVTSTGWRSSVQEFSAPTAETVDTRLKLFFRAPITQNQQITHFLEAEIRPELVLPELFPMTAVISGHPRDIWIMSVDGLIVYDKNSRYLGSNLFLDPHNQSAPSLLAFARLSLTDDDGIGYYSFVEDSREIFKIAAWEKVEFTPSKSWLVIVNYSYMSRAATG